MSRGNISSNTNHPSVLYLNQGHVTPHSGDNLADEFSMRDNTNTNLSGSFINDNGESMMEQLTSHNDDYATIHDVEHSVCMRCLEHPDKVPTLSVTHQI